jgi:hypothetical protein
VTYRGGVSGALIDWATQEEAEMQHKGIFGMGEYFAQNGLGQNARRMSMHGMGEYFAQNGLGADALVPSGDISKSEMLGMGVAAWALIGAAFGLGGGYVMFSKRGYTANSSWRRKQRGKLRGKRRTRRYSR